MQFVSSHSGDDRQITKFEGLHHRRLEVETIRRKHNFPLSKNTESTLYENSDAKPLEQEKHFNSERTGKQEREASGCPFPSAGTLPSSRGNSPEGTPCLSFQMKPEPRSSKYHISARLHVTPAPLSQLFFHLRKHRRRTSTFSGPQETPTNNVAALPPRTRLPARRRSSPTPAPEGAAVSLPALPGRIPSGGRSLEHGGTGRAPSFRFPAAAGRPQPAPSARGVPHSHSVPSIPGRAPRGAPGRGKRPSRPPEAEAA